MIMTWLQMTGYVTNATSRLVGFPKSGNNKSRFLQIRNEVLENTIKIIDRDGACLKRHRKQL